MFRFHFTWTTIPWEMNRNLSLHFSCELKCKQKCFDVFPHISCFSVARFESRPDKMCNGREKKCSLWMLLFMFFFSSQRAKKARLLYENMFFIVADKITLVEKSQKWCYNRAYIFPSIIQRSDHFALVNCNSLVIGRTQMNATFTWPLLFPYLYTPFLAFVLFLFLYYYFFEFTFSSAIRIT